MGAVNYITLLPVKAVAPRPRRPLLCRCCFPGVGWRASLTLGPGRADGPPWVLGRGRVCACARRPSKGQRQMWVAEVGGRAAWRSQLGSLGAQGPLSPGGGTLVRLRCRSIPQRCSQLCLSLESGFWVPGGQSHLGAWQVRSQALSVALGWVPESQVRHLSWRTFPRNLGWAWNSVLCPANIY